MFNRQSGIQENKQFQESKAQAQLTAVLNEYQHGYPTGLKEPAEEQSLGAKLEATFYTVNRIESQIHNIRAMLFGDARDSDGCCAGLDSVDGVVNTLKYKTEDIERTLSSIIYKMSGNV